MRIFHQSYTLHHALTPIGNCIPRNPASCWNVECSNSAGRERHCKRFGTQISTRRSGKLILVHSSTDKRLPEAHWIKVLTACAHTSRQTPAVLMRRAQQQKWKREAEDPYAVGGAALEFSSHPAPSFVMPLYHFLFHGNR